MKIPVAGLQSALEKNAVILSPMAGFSDSPYRRICRELGSAASISEFVSTDALSRDSLKSISMFRFHESERPVIFQIFGNSPDTILKACEKIIPLKPDALDLNMGCSVKKIAHKGSGAGLLLAPQKAQVIVSRMVKETGLPVSAKIRLGWDSTNLNYLEIGERLQDAGAWGIFVHGRTKVQAYSGKSSWHEIGELKKKLSIPVFGNGDITSLAMAKEYQARYALDGILVGRAAIGNPWLFAGISRNSLSYSQRLDVIRTHLLYMEDFYGADYAVILFRKHLGKYLKGIHHSATFKDTLMRVQKISVLKETLENFESF